MRLTRFLLLASLLLAAALAPRQAAAQATAAGITPCGSGISLSVTGTSSNAQLSACGSTAIVWNVGSTEAFLNWGTASSAAATTSGWSVPGGGAVVLNTGRAPLYLAAITASGTTTLRVVQGLGMTAVGVSATGGTQAVTCAACATAANQTAVMTPVAPATATATNGLLLGGQYDTTQKTLTAGQQAAYSMSPRGALYVATGAESLTVAQATAASLNATVVGTGTFATQATLPTTPTIAAGSGVVLAPSAESVAALAPVVSTAAESNHVLKSGAGNLYTLTVTIGATTGYLMIFDATSLPSNGAVTPKYCYPVVSNATLGGTTLTWSPGPPMRFATGITAGFSTTGCFTLTASTTANFFGQVD